jgi:hypothetical protein
MAKPQPAIQLKNCRVRKSAMKPESVRDQAGNDQKDFLKIEEQVAYLA